MNTVKYVPNTNYTYSQIEGMLAQNITVPDEAYNWREKEECAGFVVGDHCPLRFDEMSLVTFTPQFCRSGYKKGCEYLVGYARINVRYVREQEAIWNFATTLFTIVFLSAIFIIFNHDTETVVIKPIKKVVQIIIKLAENPLKKPAVPTEEEETGHQMKTKMLELTIFKIGTLLQRGFGELGAQIVASSLTQTDTGMDLNLPGRKVELIFSICRIRQFTETTDCLQDEIIVFVNKIVKIVHEVCFLWDGMPTKNYGEKYLLIWKLPQLENATDKLELDEKEKRKQIARAKAIEEGLDPDEINYTDGKIGELFDKADSNNGDEDTLYQGKNGKKGLDDSVAGALGERSSLLD